MVELDNGGNVCNCGWPDDSGLQRITLLHSLNYRATDARTQPKQAGLFVVFLQGLSSQVSVKAMER